MANPLHKLLTGQGSSSWSSVETTENKSTCFSFPHQRTDLTPAILGSPWLVRHNPQLNWAGSLTLSSIRFISLGATQASDPPDLSNVPVEYHEEVFSKTACTLASPPAPLGL